MGVDCIKIYQFITYNGFIVLCASLSHTEQVFIIDPKFEVKTIKFDNLATINMNDKIICHLNSKGEIKILDHELKELRTVKLHNHCFNEFSYYGYFHIGYQLNKFYCMNSQEIDIYDEKPGIIYKSIAIRNLDSIVFDGKGNFLVLDSYHNLNIHLNHLIVYNSDAVIINEIEIFNLQPDTYFNFRIGKNEQFIFLDTNSLELYIE